MACVSLHGKWRIVEDSLDAGWVTERIKATHVVYRITHHFLILAMTAQCVGCKRSFRNAHGLQLHRKHCKPLAATLKEISRRFIDQEASKVARQQGRDVGEERQAASRSDDNEAVSRSRYLL